MRYYPPARSYLQNNGSHFLVTITRHTDMLLSPLYKRIILVNKLLSPLWALILKKTGGPIRKDTYGVIRLVSGIVKNDIARQRTIGFLVEVSTEEMRACIAEKEVWRTTAYSVTMQNCVFCKSACTFNQ